MPWRWVLAINFIGARRPTFVAHKSVPFLQGVIRSGSISLMFVTDQHCRQRTIVAVGARYDEISIGLILRKLICPFIQMVRCKCNGEMKIERQRCGST